MRSLNIAINCNFNNVMTNAAPQWYRISFPYDVTGDTENYARIITKELNRVLLIFIFLLIFSASPLSQRTVLQERLFFGGSILSLVTRYAMALINIAWQDEWFFPECLFHRRRTNCFNSLRPPDERVKARTRHFRCNEPVEVTRSLLRHQY